LVSVVLRETNYLPTEDISLYLDVGANRGQTGQALRQEGYSRRIVSFEPIADTYATLVAAAAHDPLWETRHTALGDIDGSANITVMQHRDASSILPALPELAQLHPASVAEREEQISLARLDTVLPGLAAPDDRIWLKVDTQGFEKAVMQGAKQSLPRLRGVRLEIAVTGVYSGEWTIAPAIDWMSEHGFVLAESVPAWRHPTERRVLYFDLIFIRRRNGFRV
jgi:FkbM family methyltransferase